MTLAAPLAVLDCQCISCRCRRGEAHYCVGGAPRVGPRQGCEQCAPVSKAGCAGTPREPGHGDRCSHDAAGARDCACRCHEVKP